MYFAEIDPSTNIVLRVIVCDHSIEWCETNLGGTWIMTYVDVPNKNFASQGSIYYPDIDNFSAPKPYPSWILTDTLQWESPVPCPNDGKPYVWNETETKWDEQPPQPETDLQLQPIAE